MEAERRKIEAENRVMRRVFRVEEQKVIPFPSLIKVDQKQNAKGPKVVHDLKQAVQLVKVSLFVILIMLLNLQFAEFKTKTRIVSNL